MLIIVVVCRNVTLLVFRCNIGFFPFNITCTTYPVHSTILSMPFRERCLKCFTLLIVDVQATEALVDWQGLMQYKIWDEMTSPNPMQNL